VEVAQTFFCQQPTRKHTIVAVCIRVYIAGAVLAALALTFAEEAGAGIVVRQELEPGVHAAVHDGRIIFLECRLPAGAAAQALLGKYLAHPEEWTQYKGRMAIAIPFTRLSVDARRKLLLEVFAEDYVTEEGWWHTVTFAPPVGEETWYAVSEWFTGNGSSYRKVMAVEENRALGNDLRQGDRILFPRSMLPAGMRQETPDRVPPPPPPITPREPAQPMIAVEEPAPSEEAEVVPAVLESLSDGMLTYKEDSQGAYAEYRLQRGEAIYTNVVVRFTDFREVEDIRGACEVVLRRSGITDARRIDAGQRIRIPLDMLSDRYQPAGSAGRREYEAVQQEAERLQRQGVQARNLKGVTIILDPGHGGRDHGAAPSSGGLYEDEVNYDIMCRVKRLLEKETAAKVYVTMYDRSQGYTPTDATRFSHDTDEEVLTTPRYENYDARISANLRWYLANQIYRKEKAAGVDDRNIIFISIHCDAIYYKVRGTMVYVPGAAYRRDREQPYSAIYASYAEARAQPYVTTTAASRRRDEALSRNFADLLINTLRTNDPPIAVHKSGDPIRNVIRRSGGRAYVPAVLRNTMVPTKVLVEVANVNNTTDQERLRDPEWREWFAEALVKTLEKHFD
jgi:N-acetylmuramoyl-L-alanine amidase